MRGANGNIRIGNYSFDKQSILGKGATGNVYKGIKISDASSVAVKAIEMNNVNNEVTKYLLEGQKKAMREINSKNVVKCLDIVQETDYCYIIMQECRCGTLRDYIKSKGQLAETEAIPLFRKIVAGYCAVIDSLFIHRDLKTANIMLRQNKEPVIIDFGYCEMIMGKRPLIRYNVGSPSYMSPEAYQQSRYSEKSDVWALGVIFYEMLTGKTLDEGYNIKQYFQNIKNNQKVNLGACQIGFSELVNSVFKAIFTISDVQRASCHKIKYLFDKNLGPMMDLDSLPPGAIIKHINPLQTQYFVRENRQQNNNNHQGDYKSDPPPSFNFSANRNPLLKTNTNISNHTNEQCQIGSFKTLNGLNLRKQFIRKTNHNPSDRFYLKNGNAKFKGMHNIRKGSYKQQMSFQFDGSHRSNDTNFKFEQNSFQKPRISSASHNFHTNLFEAQRLKRSKVPQITQFSVQSQFRQSQANSQASLAESVANHYSLVSFQTNNQNWNPISYSKIQKHRVNTVIQGKPDFCQNIIPQVLHKVVSECPRTFGSQRML